MKNNKGFTLVELILTVALLGVVVTLASSMLFFGNRTFTNTNNQRELQSDMRLVTNFIEREVQNASNLQILETLPGTLDNSRRYIYINNDKVMFKAENQSAVEIPTTFDEIDYDVDFTKSGNTVVEYDLEGNLSGTEFHFVSEIEVRNLKGVREIDKISGNEGKVLSYAFDSDAKDITSFRFESALNNALSVDIEGHISSDTINLHVPNGTDITSLIPTFVSTGTRVTVTNVDQNSGVTSNNFTNNIIYTVHAQDGTTKDYNVNVNILPATPPNASGARIIPTDPDGTVTPIAWNTSTLNANYTYIPNGNGTEGNSKFEWYSSDSKNGTYSLISGAESSTFNPENYSDKWIKFRVKPVSSLGVEGDDWVESDPVEIFNNNNPFWKKIVEDLWYTNATAQEQADFNQDYGSDYSDDVQLVYNENFKRYIDTTNNHSVVADMEEQSVIIRGRGWGASSEHQFGIDLDYDKFNIDSEGYTFTFDTVLSSTTWGWGLSFSSQPGWNAGNIGSLFNNLNGYAFQFDPGADGFVMRRFYNGGSTSLHELGANNLNSNRDATYQPSAIVKDPGFSWRGTNDGVNSRWDLNYTTEMTVQRQLDGSLIVRVITWRTDIGKENGASEPMWYGDFGSINYNRNTYVGVHPSNKNYNDFNDKSLYNIAFGGEPSSFLGFRTWASGNYRADFLNLDVSDGFSMNINDAYFLTNDSIYMEFDQDIRNSIKLDYDGNDLIYFDDNSYSVLDAFKIKDNAIVIKLDSPIQNTVINQGININLERGSVGGKFSGDININNGIGYTINEISNSVFNEDFDSLSNGWQTYGNGKIEVINSSNSYLRKTEDNDSQTNNDDPNGGYKDLDQIVNSSFILSGKVRRFNTNGGEWDRFAISNDSGTGYGLAIGPNEFRLEKRINGTGYKIYGDLGYRRPNNEWQTFIFVWLKEENKIILQLYDESGNFKSGIQSVDSSYDEFTRFYVHGGYEFGLDDLKIGLFK